jgi:hypothetical protein
MSQDPERCKISIVPKGKNDWTLELSGDCGDTLKVIEALPPRKRGYLNRRLRIEA